MKILLLTLAFIAIFAGCSAKEFNSGVDSISGDISKAFNDSRDTSQK